MKKIIINTVMVLIIFIIICGVIFSCVKKDNNSDLKTVKVAEVARSIFYAPQYVAISNGYFEEYGIEIDLTLASGADKVSAAVLSGDVDIGFCGSETTIYVYNGGEDDYLMTFAQLTQKDGSFIVSREKIDDFTIEDLKGSYIIGGREGGMPEMTLEWILTENGIDPKDDLTIDTSISFASMSGAFISGIGDYVSLFEPTASEVVSEGYGYIVASLGELGGVVPYTAYNARISYIEENPDVIEGFTKAIQKGLDFVNNNDSEEIAKIIQEFFPDTSLEDLTNTIEVYKNQDTWPDTTSFTEESFDHLQEIMINAGQLEEKVSYEDLIYSEYFTD